MNILVTAALAFFFAVGLGLAAAGGIRAAWRGLGRRRGVSAALAAFAVVATICAQKPGPSGPTITIDALLRDAGCYATNDVFHAAVSNAPAYAAIDFSACPVLVYARERGQTNAADWAELTPRRTFSELPADYAIANATNYNYMVYLDYVPPSPVHTNGVFELHGFVVPDDEPGNLEQLSAGFINSRAVLLPPTASDYIQNGLVAMWDGIENAGWGIHDPNATTWKDLVGSYDAVREVADWQYNCAVFNGTASRVAKTGSLLGKPSNVTAEVVYDRTASWGGCIIGCTQSGGWSIWPTSQSVVDYWCRGYAYSLKVSNTTDQPGVRYTRTLAAGTGMRCYKDATQVGYTASGSVIQYNNNCGFNIGADSNGSSYGVEHPLTGHIYCVRVYSRMLTPEEIQYNYNIDKRRFNLP